MTLGRRSPGTAIDVLRWSSSSLLSPSTCAITRMTVALAVEPVLSNRLIIDIHTRQL